MDTINEIEAKQRAERRQIRDDAEVLSDLMRHKGWGRYMSIIETIAQNYHATIMKPVENAQEWPRIEYAKGALAGLSLATSVPQMKIREAHEVARTSADE